MRRPALLICGVLLGLSLGYFGREALTSPVDRVAEGLAAFEAICLPYAQGAPKLPALPFERISAPLDASWAQGSSRFLVSLSPANCTVTDVLDPMAAPEREAFRSGARDLIARLLPELTRRDPDPLGWEFVW